MTREEQINEAVKTCITETLMSTPNYEISPCEIDMLECAFEKGAEWADQHPINPWHDASKELPTKGGHYICMDENKHIAKLAYCGTKWINSATYNDVELELVKYWMPNPELPKEE